MVYALNTIYFHFLHLFKWFLSVFNVPPGYLVNFLWSPRTIKNMIQQTKQFDFLLTIKKRELNAVGPLYPALHT